MKRCDSRSSWTESRFTAIVVATYRGGSPTRSNQTTSVTSVSPYLLRTSAQVETFSRSLQRCSEAAVIRRSAQGWASETRNWSMASVMKLVPPTNHGSLTSCCSIRAAPLMCAAR